MPLTDYKPLLLDATQSVEVVHSHAERGNEVVSCLRGVGIFVCLLLIIGCAPDATSPPAQLEAANPQEAEDVSQQDAQSITKDVPTPVAAENPVVAKDPQADETNSTADEKQYDGRTLTEWRRLIKGLDPADPAAAQAVPGLTAIVADRQAPWYSRRQAAQTLGRIGPAAKSAIPLLIELLNEMPDGETKDGESITPLWAAKALALYGAEAKEAAPALIARLKDKSAEPVQRQVTLDALSRIGTADSAVLPALIAVVSSTEEEPELRTLTADSLAYLGSRAAAAVPALLRVTESDNEPLRRSAVMAIGAVGPMADVAVPTLARMLVFDESAAVRDQAAAALAQIGSPAIDLLTRLLADEDPQVRWRAAQSLGQIRPPVQSAIPALTERLKDDDGTVRIHAMESLWAIQSDAEPLIPFVLEEFTNPDRQLRIRAFKLLIAMGDRAKPAIDPLQILAEDERPFVRQTARKALEALGVGEGD